MNINEEIYIHLTHTLKSLNVSLLCITILRYTLKTIPSHVDIGCMFQNYTKSTRQILRNHDYLD